MDIPNIYGWGKGCNLIFINLIICVKITWETRILEGEGDEVDSELIGVD